MKNMWLPLLFLWAFVGKAVMDTIYNTYTDTSMFVVPPEQLDTEKPEVQDEIMTAINKCRAEVRPTASNMAKAVWSEEVRKTALKYAHVCSQDHSKVYQRTLSDNMTCGENLYFASFNASWTKAITSFCDEKKNFVYSIGPIPSTAVTGHYTQLVWATSFLSGCAHVYCPSQPIYKNVYVCQQCPPGNTDKKHKPYKRGETCGDCKGHCVDGLCTNPCPKLPEYSNCKDYKPRCDEAEIREACPRTCGCTNNEIIYHNE